MMMMMMMIVNVIVAVKHRCIQHVIAQLIADCIHFVS